MNPIQNFAFEGKLVRVIARDGEPWFVAMDVCAQLEIKNVSMAIEKLDNDERDAVSLTDSIGRSQMTSILSEGGVFALVLRSKLAMTPGTVQHRFRKWVTGEVLPQIRRTGSYGTPRAETPPESGPQADWRLRLETVREARILYGTARARSVWQNLGLPEVPELAPQAGGDARACLARLLDADCPQGRVGDLLRAVLAGDVDLAPQLAACGLRAGDGVFYVASGHPFIRRLYRASAWPHPAQVLRRLEGAVRGKVMKFAGLASHAVEIPADYADWPA